MSEHTTESTANTTDEDGFAAADSEPSMEDILASIRKIISDDADPEPLEGPDFVDLGTASVAQATLAPVADTRPIVSENTVGAEVEAFDLDSLLGELDIDADTDTDIGSFADTLGLGDTVAVDDTLTIPDIEPEGELSTMIDIDEAEDDMDRLMSELLVDMDDPLSTPEPTIPVAATVTTQAVTDADDMDVVKSLMADLTDDDLDPSFEIEASGSDDLEEIDFDEMMKEFAGFEDVGASALAAPAGSDAVETPSIDLDTDDLDTMEDDIFESILEMTLDDEVQAFDAQAEIDENVPSLADIAAAADAEAVAEVTATEQSVAVAATLAVGAAATTVSNASVPDTVDAPSDPTHPAPSTMETPMPRAVRSDAILDDVTETATMSAFAELNQVVEDKAILSERGPRIGDLVQDALKPMLKEWLDENIQGIVERAVAKEVSRIATGK